VRAAGSAEWRCVASLAWLSVSDAASSVVPKIDSRSSPPRRRRELREARDLDLVVPVTLVLFERAEGVCARVLLTTADAESGSAEGASTTEDATDATEVGAEAVDGVEGMRMISYSASTSTSGEGEGEGESEAVTRGPPDP